MLYRRKIHTCNRYFQCFIARKFIHVPEFYNVSSHESSDMYQNFPMLYCRKIHTCARIFQRFIAEIHTCTIIFQCFCRRKIHTCTTIFHCFFAGKFIHVPELSNVFSQEQLYMYQKFPKFNRRKVECEPFLILWNTYYYSRDLMFARRSPRYFIFTIRNIFYNPNIRNNLRGLYFRVSLAPYAWNQINFSPLFLEQKRLLLGSNLQETGSEHHVAFYAHLSKNVDNVGHHQPIVFDTVDYNDGRAYNAVDGEFITKVAGTYMFIWTISARDNTYMETELVVNGVVFGHVIADAAQHTDWGVATGFAITKLSIGDHVWVRSGTIISGHLTGVGFGTSSFAGFLMYH